MNLSGRALNFAEVASVCSSILMAEWALAPFAFAGEWMIAGPPLIALVFMIYSHYQRHETAQLLGFGASHFARALRLLAAPTFIAICALLLLDFFMHSPHSPQRASTRFALLPLWALLQQYALLGFIYRRLRAASSARNAIIVASVIFSLLHAPNYILMILTLVGALIWTTVYERAPNLFAPALSHVLLSIVVFVTVPDSLLPSMAVGYNYLQFL